MNKAYSMIILTPLAFHFGWLAEQVPYRTTTTMLVPSQPNGVYLFTAKIVLRDNNEEPPQTGRTLKLRAKKGQAAYVSAGNSSMEVSWPQSEITKDCVTCSVRVTLKGKVVAVSNYQVETGDRGEPSAELDERRQPIQGRVVTASRTSVSLTVGSEEGVTLGMRFILLNSANEYLGDLEITEVSPHACTGERKFLFVKVSIGDLAIDELNCGEWIHNRKVLPNGQDP